MIMNIQQNAGAPAYQPPPPPAPVAQAPAPIIIKEKTSNTACIVITIVCCCIVVIAAVVIGIFVFAASKINDHLAPATTTTTETTTTLPTTLLQSMTNICIGGESADFLVGDEVWNDGEFGDDEFAIVSPNFWDSDGNGPSNGIADDNPIPPSDCTINLTPKNADEKIFLMLAIIDITPENGMSISDPLTDMAICGENYISINGNRLCGMQYSMNPAFMDVQLGDVGETVEIKLNTVDEVDNFFQLAFYTATEARNPFTTNYYSTTPAPFMNQGSIDSQTVDICDGHYEYYVTSGGSFSSPNHPSNYPSSQSCGNRYSTSSDGVTFSIVSFNTEENADTVSFENYFYSQIYYLSGSISPGTRLSFSGPYIDVHFASDFNIDYQGFTIDVLDGYEPSNDIDIVYPNLRNENTPKKKPQE